jgi:hypothetical protein
LAKGLCRSFAESPVIHIAAFAARTFDAVMIALLLAAFS